MSLALLIAIPLRAAAVLWSLVAWWRLRDGRIGFLTILLLTTGARLALSIGEHYHREHLAAVQWSVQLGEVLELVFSVLSLFVVHYLVQMVVEPRRTAEALRESEERFRLLAENVPGVIYLCRNDSRYGMIYLNDAVEELTGYPKEDFLEDRMSFVDLYHPDDGRAIFPEVNRALTKRESFRLLYRLRHKDGRWRWIDEVGLGVWHGEELVWLEGFLSDVTARKQAEDFQRASRHVLERLAAGASLEEVLHLLVRTAEDIRPGMWASVLLLDDDKRRLRRGAAPSLPDFYNRAIDGLEIGPEVGSCGTCAATGKRVIVADVMTHPYWRPFRDIARRAGLGACWSEPILSSAGDILGTFAMYYPEPREPDEGDLDYIRAAAHLAGIAIDRSRTEAERREVQRKLIEHQRQETDRVEAELAKAKDELVHSTRLATIGRISAQIAHDIRNPLGAILNTVSFLKRELPHEPPKWQEGLALIAEEVQDCNRIINQLLDITRPKPLRRKSADLEELIDRAVKRFAVPDGVRIHVDCQPQPFVMHVDVVQFRHVLDNLLRNALDAVGKQGEIAIRAVRRGVRDVVVVQDSGPGIPDDQREAVFDFFFTTKARGTGLGLGICRRLVEQHGGTIRLLENDTGGAAIELSLPVLSAQQPTTAETQREATEAAASR